MAINTVVMSTGSYTTRRDSPFAVEFDDLPRLIAERDDYRILVMSGTLLAGFSVIGQLAADGAVELVQLDLDTELDW
jgi:hypothetical protein